jgi:predicted DCC family thiol-disulfide oxidoreductase YuxK
MWVMTVTWLLLHMASTRAFTVVPALWRIGRFSHSAPLTPRFETIANTDSMAKVGSLSDTAARTVLLSDATVTGGTSLPSIVALDQPVILFDGVCNFCNTWVDLLLRIDVNKKFKFAPLQSPTGQRLLQAVGKDANDISSVVLIQPDLVSYDKSSCVLQVVTELGPLARIASGTAQRLLPARFRDSIYDLVAENRYSLMGKREECRCGDPKYADRFLS